MAGRLLQRLRTKEPAQLVQQCHQAFLRLPFEANPERVADEIAKLLHSMKVRGPCGLCAMAVIRCLGIACLAGRPHCKILQSESEVVFVPHSRGTAAASVGPGGAAVAAAVRPQIFAVLLAVV